MLHGKSHNTELVIHNKRIFKEPIYFVRAIKFLPKRILMGVLVYTQEEFHLAIMI